jgi:type IV pilus assembly protein PilX
MAISNKNTFLSIEDKQTGAVLFIGLLMLAVISLIAVSSMQSSNLQELMAANELDQIAAFEAAESAIREAEARLQSGEFSLADFDSDTSDGRFEFMYDQVWNEINWNTESILAENIEGVSAAPRFVIQYLGEITSDDLSVNVNIDNAYNQTSRGATSTIAQLFRITARGTGRSDNSVAVIESVFGVSNF